MDNNNEKAYHVTYRDSLYGTATYTIRATSREEAAKIAIVFPYPIVSLVEFKF